AFMQYIHWLNADRFKKDACREAHIRPPVFQFVSEMREGRTAWSSRVTVREQTHSARFWYDGNNMNNAKEDAAEMALNHLTGPGSSFIR
ncbi:hypothetical protein CSPAE12_11866, partial [Colletotrichum incanum]